MLMMLVLAASAIYLFEHAEQPEAFGSIPAALWWAVATLTTVGYGDVTPMTAGGKAFGTCVMIVGVCLVALPTGILASAFNEQMRQRREDYKALIDNSLQDGVIMVEESVALERLRLQLGLSEELAQKIFTRESKESPTDQPVCPH